MDGDRFDALARSLATPRSRRAVVRALAGSAAGGLLALAGRHPAGADPCKGTGKECKKGIQCCSGSCVPPTDSISTHGSGSVCCPTGQVQYPTGACCTPDVGTTTCANRCGTVINNCGQSVTCPSCPEGQCLTCSVDGTCVTTCTGVDQTCCRGGCRLIDGAIGCTADDQCCSSVCVAGVCQAGASPEGGPCDSDTDCAAGTVCVIVAAGQGFCCASGNACTTGCCATGNEVCSTETGGCCAPTTCAAAGANCGVISDGCGSTLDCDSITGGCQGTETCGGSGVPNVCGCDPVCDGKACGADDGCGAPCQTGTCNVCNTCNAGVCQPTDIDSTCDGECVGGACQPVICKTVLDECSGEDVCCEDLICGWDETSSTRRACCRPVGHSCNVVVGGSGCCSGTVCRVVNEVLELSECVGCDGDFNHAFGGPACATDGQCCSNFCDATSGNCCRPLGGPCGETGPLNGDCCFQLGLTCSGSLGRCVNCGREGDACEVDATGVSSTCCIGLACQSGACVHLNGCGGFCQVDDTCCFGQACINGACQNVCGGPCQDDTPCCPGQTCQSGFCNF